MSLVSSVLFVFEHREASAASVGCDTISTELLLNSGFEEPVIPPVNYRFLNESVVPGWETTATNGQMEFWSSGFQGVPAYSGNQFAELNASQVSTLYQDIPTIPGSRISYTVAHRGRSGVDVFDILIGPPGGTGTSMSGGAGFADGTTAWGVYTNTYVIPAGQTTTRFAFEALSSSGGASAGNFLDIERFGVLSIEACPDVNATYANTPVSGSAFANDASIDTISLVSYGQPSSGSVVMNPDGTYTYTPDPGFTGIDSYTYTVTDDSGNEVTTTVTITVTNAPIPVLETTKSVAVIGATDAVEGGTLRYTVTTTNTGEDEATNTILTDGLPLGASYVPGSLEVVSGNSTAIGPVTDASGDDIGFSITGNSVAINAGAGATATSGGTFAVGDSVTYQFEVMISNGVAPGSIENTAAATYIAPELGSELTTNSNTTVTPVSTLADLTVVKSADVASIVAGDEVTYTVTVTNAGPSSAASTMVTDTLPAGMTLISATPSVGSCAAGTTTCDVGSLAAGDSATITYLVSTSSTLAPGSFAVNTATVATETPESTTANNTVAIATPVIASADVSVEKTATPSPITPGNDVTWTITATNNGPSAADEVVVQDTLPAGTTLVSATPTVGVCDNTISCDLGQLDSGDSITIAIVATVDSAQTDPLSNTATVSSTTPDPDPSNNTSTISTLVDPSADLVVAKSAGETSFVAGTPGSWTYAITNNGPSNALNVVSSDPAPAGVTWTSASTTLGSCTTTATLINCTHGTLPSGALVTVTVIGDIDAAAATSSTTIDNTASANSSTPDPNETNNASTSSTPLTDEVVLETTKVATPDPAIAGSPLTYTVTVINLGPSMATGVTVDDPIPANTSFTNPAPSSTIGTCATAGSTVNCSVGLLAVGQVATITIPVEVDPAYTGDDLVNTATADSDQTPPQTPTWSSTVTQQADLQLIKSVVGEVMAGENGDWSFTVTNAGPSAAMNVALNDSFPAGVTFVSSSVSECTGAVGASSVSCTWPTIVAGDSVTFTTTTSFDESLAAGPLSNTAQVEATTPGDPTPSNNTSTATTNISRLADIAIEKTGPAVFTAGTGATYSVTASNDGPSSATDTVVSDVLPAGLTFTAAGSDPRCTATGSLVTCDLGTIDAGDSTTFALAVDVDAALADGAVIENIATISTTTPEDDLGDNTSSTSGTVEATADLVIDKSAPASVTAGESATWTVTLTNLGPSNAAAAAVSDPAPAGVTWTNIVSSSALLSCTLATGECGTAPGTALPAGTAITLTYTGDIDAAVTGSTIVNTASVDTPTTDPNPGNETSTTTTPVVVDADLVVTKTATDDEPTAGLPTTWTITVTNEGPSAAEDVELVDSLPSGVTATDMVTTAGTCDLATTTCDLGDVAPGETITIGITGLLDSDLAEGVGLTNTADVSSPTPDPESGNNSSSVTTNVDTSADLSIAKMAVGATVTAGSDLSWVISVVNSGPSDAIDVTMVDAIPSSIIAATATATPLQGTCTITGGVVDCDLGTLAVGDATTITVTGQVDAGATPGNAIENTATVDSITPDPNPSNNEATETIETGALANIIADKIYTGPSLVAGSQNPTWEITVSNTGPSNAQNVELIESFPATVDAVSLTPSQGTCDFATLTCALGTIAPGAFVTVVVEASIQPGHTGDLVNNASATTSTPESDLTDNASSTTTPVASSADVSIVKTAVPATAVPGENITWTLTVDNAGPSSAENVTVEDLLASGITLVSVTPTSGTCTSTISCDLGELGPSQTETITVVATVASGETASVVNSATIMTTTPDADPENNTSTVTTPLTPSADLSISKTADASPITAGTPASWTYTIVNNGPSDALDVVSSDTAPTGVTWTSASTTLGSCTTTATLVECTHATLPSGASLTVNVIGNVGSTAAITASTIENTATVDSPVADPEPGNNSSTSTTPLTDEVVLEAIKVATPDPAIAGSALTYTVTVTNIGPSAANGVTVEDAIPAGTTFSGPAPTSTIGSCSTAGSDLSCSVGLLDVGETAIITIPVEVDPSYLGGELINTANVDSDQTNPLSPTWSSTVDQQADLQLTKTSLGDVTAGETSDWSFTITNNGPSTATDVSFVDVFPSGVTFVSTSEAACSGLAGSDTLSCAWPLLADGASITFTATTLFDPALASGPIANSATVTAVTPSDPTTSNNTSTTTKTVERLADVSIVKTGPSTVVAGETVTYTLTATNDGPSTATSTVISDALTTGLTFDATASNAQCSAAGSLVSCAIGTLDPGESVTLSITADVSATITQDEAIVNTATISTTTPETNLADNTSTTTANTDTSANLTIDKVAPDAIMAGEPATWTVTVTNLGPSNAANVTVADPSPAGVTWTTVTSSSALLDCVVATGVCETPANTSIPVGATITVAYTGDVSASVVDATIENTATLASSTPDPDPTNNTSTTTTSVSTEADLVVTKTANEAEPTAGLSTTWTIEVTNNGPSDAQSVVVEDVLPPSVTLIEMTSSSGPCTVATATCDLGTVAVNGSVTIELEAQIDSGHIGDLTNTATVNSVTSDPNPDNNTDESTTPVVLTADVQLVKVADPAPAVAGENITWVLTATNAGPSLATDVTVSDTLPAGVTLVSATPSVGECSTAISCDLGELGPDQSETVTVVASIDPDLVAPLTNAAAATTTTPDPDPSNNESTVTTDVEPQADLEVVKLGGSESATAGTEATWQISVTNHGPSVAVNSTLIDPAPDGVAFTSVSSSSSNATCVIVDGSLDCAFGDLLVGETIVVSVNGALDPEVDAGSIVNTASASADTPDPDPENSSGTSTTTTSAVSDLNVEKIGPESVVPGTAATWQILVTNNGPSTARSVEIMDLLPPDVDLVSLTTDIATVMCDEQTGVCAVDEMLVGQTATVTVVADVPGAFEPDELANTATAFASGSIDPDLTNNTDEWISIVEPPHVNLIVDKWANQATGEIGDTITWTIRVTNEGPSTATDVVVAELLPEQLQFDRAAVPFGDWDDVSMTWSLGSLTSGETAEMTVVSTTLGSGEVTNTVIVESSALDRPVAVAASIEIQAPPTPAAPSPLLAFSGFTGIRVALTGVTFLLLGLAILGVLRRERVRQW